MPERCACVLCTGPGVEWDDEPIPATAVCGRQGRIRGRAFMPDLDRWALNFAISASV